MASLGERFRNGWNAFLGRSPTGFYGYGGSGRPDRIHLSFTNARSIVGSIYNRIAVDVSSANIVHARLNDEGKYLKTIPSNLNYALNISANKDQTGRELIRDIVMSMFDEGCVALIPTDTDLNPNYTESYDIFKIRTGRVVEWYPDFVRVLLYREKTGQKEEVLLNKDFVPIIENPFYSIMNEPNSVLQRLIRVLNQIDRTNEENSSGKLDLIVQVPYTIHTPAKQALARRRRREIERQLSGNSQYGIAYVDGTERVVQLNRPLENNLWEQAIDLTQQLYNELGLTQSIFDGTADEKTLLNYYDRTIDPILCAIVENMRKKWLSKTAITQKQSILYFRDPFRFVPVSQIAEIADKFTRNEIMSSNEIRSVIGLKPSSDPKADELRNSNLNHGDEDKYNQTIPEEDLNEILKNLNEV